MKVIGCIILTAWGMVAEGAVVRGLKAISVADGFTVELAAGPDLAPYGMLADFDERGRLFIAASSGKNIGGKAMSDKPECRILMLEDRDGDGRFDRSTVYADQVGIPMGLLCWRGDVYTASPPDVLRLRDTNGDGGADKREVLASGWHVRGTASLHGPFLGPEGRLYLTDGRHGFDIKTKDGRAFKGLAARIWRMNPDGTGLESVAGGGFDNPVELTFTPAGEMIGTMTYFTNPKNGQRDGLMHFLEGGVYSKWHSSVAEFTRTGDLLGPMTRFARVAPAGLMRYSGLSFGAEFAGNLFSAQFNPHRVQRHVMRREGATFVTEDSDFLVSTDPDFRPTDVLEAPDGSLIVIDTGGWYIDQCPLSRISRPEHKGGVYRIRQRNAPRVADPLGLLLAEGKRTPAQWAQLLRDPRPKVQARALEQLADSDETVVMPLAGLLANPKANPATWCRAIWALHRQGSPAARAVIRNALEHPTREVRIAAARSTGLAADKAAILPVLKGLREPDAGVSREMATALGFMGCNNATGPLADAASRSKDPHHDHALIHALIQLNVPEALRDRLGSTEPRVQRAALIALDQVTDSPLQAADVVPLLRSQDAELAQAALWVMTHHPDWADHVVDHLDRLVIATANWSAAQQATLREAITVFAENAKVQAAVFAWLDGRPLHLRAPLEPRRPFLLHIMGQAAVRPFPKAWETLLGDVITNDRRSEPTRLAALQVIRTRHLTGLDETVHKVAGDAGAPVRVRLAALEALGNRMKPVPQTIQQFLRKQHSPTSNGTRRAAAARVAGQLPWTEAQRRAIASNWLPVADGLTWPLLLPAFRESADAETGRLFVRALLTAPPGALTRVQVEPVLKSYPPAVQAAAEPLMKRLAQAQASEAKRLDELAPLLTGGDVGRGRAIFFGQKAVCGTCHAIGDQGGDFGPDLTSIGAIRSGRDILEAIVFPNATQVPGHEAFQVKAGAVHVGIVVSETATTLSLRSAPGVTLSLERDQITDITPAPVSLMPAGLDRNLTSAEFRDLLAFLQSQNGERWLQPSRLGNKDLRVRDSGIRE